jgi:hypothetical protein
MSFGYATGEFEVTAERLGVYRPEEHIDNPKDYADNEDARKYDPRLRGPVSEAELAVDPNTGMKNYIANEQGGWVSNSIYNCTRQALTWYPHLLVYVDRLREVLLRSCHPLWPALHSRPIGPTWKR